MSLNQSQIDINTHIIQVGMGVVGYAYALAFKKNGFKVSGIESNKELIEKYKNEFDMYHINDDLSKLTNVNYVLISINTPLKGDSLNLTYLFSSLNNMATIVKNNPKVNIILRSSASKTTPTPNST